MKRTEQQVAQAATRIAGSIFEDADGTVTDRLDAAIAWENRGTDADLTGADRVALVELRTKLED